MLSQEEGTAALEILDKLPLVKKLQEKVMKLSFKDPNEILDYSSPTKLTYQLKVVNEIKNIKHTQMMLEKGFISHISKIFLNKKLHVSPHSYKVLTSLIIYFN